MAHPSTAPQVDPILPLDMRLIPVAAAAWLTAALAVRTEVHLAYAAAGILTVVAVAALLASRGSRRLMLAARPRLAGLAVPLATAALVASASAPMLAERTDPMWLAAVRGEATVTATVTAATDPRPLAEPDRYTGARRYLVEGRIQQFSSAGQRTSGDIPVTIIGGAGWSDVVLGDTVRTAGSLRAVEPGERSAGLLFARTPPSDIVPAGGLLSLSADLRQRLIDAMPVGLPLAQSLLPGMLVGDRSQLTPELDTAMKSTGLTHLTAVSGEK